MRCDKIFGRGNGNIGRVSNNFLCTIALTWVTD